MRPCVYTLYVDKPVKGHNLVRFSLSTPLTNKKEPKVRELPAA